MPGDPLLMGDQETTSGDWDHKPSGPQEVSKDTTRRPASGDDPAGRVEGPAVAYPLMPAT